MAQPPSSRGCRLQWMASESGPQIVWPTAEQVRNGLARLEKYLPFWKISPALFVSKPRLGLIVALRSFEHDARYFTLSLKIEEALVAPPNFDIADPVPVSCVWNQPYLSLSPGGIHAPYGFSLHFGTEGVQCARELTAQFGPHVDGETLLPLLKGCFPPKSP
jgi:hypothetical protein